MFQFVKRIYKICEEQRDFDYDLLGKVCAFLDHLQNDHDRFPSFDFLFNTKLCWLTHKELCVLFDVFKEHYMNYSFYKFNTSQFLTIIFLATSFPDISNQTNFRYLNYSPPVPHDAFFLKKMLMASEHTKTKEDVKMLGLDRVKSKYELIKWGTEVAIPLGKRFLEEFNDEVPIDSANNSLPSLNPTVYPSHAVFHFPTIRGFGTVQVTLLFT